MTKNTTISVKRTKDEVKFYFGPKLVASFRNLYTADDSDQFLIQHLFLPRLMARRRGETENQASYKKQIEQLRQLSAASVKLDLEFEKMVEEVNAMGIELDTNSQTFAVCMQCI